MVAGVEYLGQKYRSSVDFPHSVDRMEGLDSASFQNSGCSLILMEDAAAQTQLLSPCALELVLFNKRSHRSCLSTG